MLDAKPGQSPPDLGLDGPLNRLAGLRGEEIVAAPVGIEAQRQALAAKHLKQGLEGRRCPFLGHEEGRIDPARRVVERHDQVHGGQAGHPHMARPVLVQHHPRQRLARPLAAMRPTPRRRLQQAGPMQKCLGPGVTPGIPVVTHQMFVKMLGCKPFVPRLVKLRDPLALICRNLPAGGLAQPTIRQSSLAILAIAPAPAAKRSLVDAQ